MHAGIDQRCGDLRRWKLPQSSSVARFKDFPQLLLDRIAFGIAALVMVVVGEHHIV